MDACEKTKKIGMTNRFRLLILLPLVLIVAIVVLSVGIVIASIRGAVSTDYIGFYSDMATEKFEIYLKNDVQLVENLSETDKLRAWFSDESDSAKKLEAFEECMAYIDVMSDALLYFGINSSLNEYVADGDTVSSEFDSFDVFDPENENSNWYYSCISSAEMYTLDIGVDKASQTQRIWISHKVLSDSGEILGAFCAGLEFEGVSDALFEKFDNKSVRSYVVDSDLNIRIDSNLDKDVENHGSILDLANSFRLGKGFAPAIDAHFDSIDGYFSTSGEPSIIKLKDSEYNYMSISKIAGSDWTVITLFDSSSLINISKFVPLFLIVILSLLTYAVACSILVRRLLINPLNRLAQSVSQSEGGGTIYGQGRKDEIGELADTIQSMRDNLCTYNESLSGKDREGERQRALLHAINKTAAILLSSDDGNLQESLEDGMNHMAECMSVDRINIWKNTTQQDDIYYVRQFGWSRDSFYDMPQVASSGFSYSKHNKEWYKKFKDGSCVNGPVGELSKDEQNRLTPYGIISVLAVPVFIQDKFWGFVSFDDCQQRRTFTEDEVSILRSGSLMLASAINRIAISARVREADERTRIMLDATPMCCNLWDENLENIECNEAAVELFGLGDKTEYKEKFFELSPPLQPNGRPSAELAREKLAEALKTGKCVFEWMHQKLDGTPLPTEVILVRVKRGKEKIVAGYTRDLSRYSKMMEQIEYKDLLLRTVNDAATILLESESDGFEDGLWRCMGMMADAVKVDRVYIWKNHIKDGELYTTQMYEWSEGAAPQQGCELAIDIPYTETAPGWEETLSSGRCVNGLVKDMTEATRAQLEAQDIKSILIVPVFLQEQFWGFVGFDDCKNERIFTGDEEHILRSGSLLIAHAMLRNDMAIAQRDSSSKMEAVLKNYTGVIFSVDKDYTVTQFNGLYLREMGLEEIVEGTRLNESDVSAQRNLFDKVVKTFESGAQEWLEELGGGTYNVQTTPLVGEDGSIIGVAGSFNDITETIRLQKELEKALEEARNASRAKTDFLSNMSHEMRTPMNAIIGMTALARGSTDIEKKDYCLGKIEGASVHLLGVINDILDMSKIEANKFSLSLVDFSFEKTLQKAVNVTNFRVEQKHQDFMVHIDSKIPDKLIGDDQRIMQVATNLLSNAVKFTPERGSIRLDADFISEENDECIVRVSITDTGIGISKEQQAKLFSSFQQAETSTSRRFGGTGLGLAISKRIIEMMDGRIWVESEPGNGSRFSFEVKLRRGASEAASIIVNRPNARVLVVDDSAEVLEYFKEILGGHSINCDTAISGEAACELIKKNGAYGVYFVDWRMPGMNGIEFTRFVKDRDEDKSVVIMISSTEWATIEDDAKDAGVDKFLPKPLFPTEILECLKECLGERTVPLIKEDAISASGRFKGYRILLAEDVEVNREIVLAMLEDSGVEIDCAENGKQACALFDENHENYDMIFMDIQMPEMDGLAATRFIRSISTPKAKTIPIVAMTANVFKEDVEKCLAAGMNDHVGKPLNFEEVLDKMEYYLTKK